MCSVVSTTSVSQVCLLETKPAYAKLDFRISF